MREMGTTRTLLCRGLLCAAAMMMASSAGANALLRYYFPPEENLNTAVTTQVCIYGGTSSGVAAALELKRLGISTVIVHPGIRLGGLTTGEIGRASCRERV